MAGTFAREVQARMLVLTHFSPRYLLKPSLQPNRKGFDLKPSIQYLVDEASHHCPGTAVIAAKDFMVLRVRNGFEVDDNYDSPAVKTLSNKRIQILKSPPQITNFYFPGATAKNSLAVPVA